MKMSSNLANRKRDEDELGVPCEEDWDQEIYSNSSNFVYYDKYGKGKVVTFGQLSSISGQNKIQAYLTKTVPKLEDNTHKEHQPITQTRFSRVL